MFYKVLCYVFLVMLCSTCRSRTSNSELTAEQNTVNLLNAELDYANSISLYAKKVTALGQTLYKIKQVQAGGNNKGFGLAGNGVQVGFIGNNAKNELELRMKEAEIQGVNTQSYANALEAQTQAQKVAGSNAAQIMAMQNEKSKIAAQNQKTLQESAGIAVENVGKAIDNQGKVLDNMDKALDLELKKLEILLKASYVNAYRLYVNIYGVYTIQLGKIWRQIGSSAKWFGKVQQLFKRYHKQSQICESRYNRSLDDLNKVAARERLDKILTYESLPVRLSSFAGSSRAENCFIKAALSEQSNLDAEELYHIDYGVDYGSRGTPPGVSCPELKMTKAIVEVETGEGNKELKERETLQIGDTPLDAQVTIAEWPPAKYDEETGNLQGYYAPVTYLQVFTMFVTQGADVKINPPPADESYDVCLDEDGNNIRKNRKMKPLFANYLTASNEIEKAMFDRKLEVGVPEVVGAKKNGYNYNKTKNRHYNDFLNKFTTIFAKADTCATEGGPEIKEITEARALGGAVPSTVFNVYNDPYSPLMSEALRQCWELGEQFRKRAKDQIELSKELYEVMEKAAKISPPRAPHPTQFQPGPPQTTNGNNF